MTETSVERPAGRARPRPHRDDVLIAVAGIVGGLLAWALGIYASGPPPAPPFRAMSLVTLLVMAGCELLRRTAPQVAVTVAAVTVVTDMVVGSLLVTLLMFTDVVYAAVLYGPRRMTRTVPAVSVVATVGLTAVTLYLTRDPAALWVGLMSALISISPASTGLIVRNYRDRAAADRLRAEQTALLAEWDRTQAVTAERARMARELHDMVANHLSAVAIHSSAALSLDRPDTTREALLVIRENSVQGLAEMRRLIGLLREDSGEHGIPSAAPRLDALDSLLARARSAGGEHGLEFVLRDRRPESGPRPPAPVELAAYRIVQESVTNTLKHAGPGTVTVTLDGAGHALTVRVDSPYQEPSGPRAPGSEAGLIGMRERADLLGGEFTAGPTTAPDGPRIWRVHAVLPTHEEPTP